MFYFCMVQMNLHGTLINKKRRERKRPHGNLYKGATIMIDFKKVDGYPLQSKENPHGEFVLKRQKQEL